MIAGVLIGKVSDAPRRINSESSGKAFVVFTVRRSIVTPGKTFPRFYKVMCFAPRAVAEAESLQVDEVVAIAIQDIEAECYESKSARSPGWKAVAKLTAASVERVGTGGAESAAHESPAVERQSNPPGGGRPAPAPQQDITDEDVPF